MAQKLWNGWGTEDSDLIDDLNPLIQTVLLGLVGKATPLPEATLEDALATVPASRLPEHPLVDRAPETRLRHARGQSMPDLIAARSGEFGSFPDGVAFPASSEQVAELLRFAAEQDVSVIPYGGGTSVVGHINPEAGARPVLTVSLARLSGLIALDTDSQIATFGAGTPGPVIEAELGAKGYMLGHFPQSWELSTLGGWVASRSSGQQSMRYGRIEQMFAGGSMETPVGRLDIPTCPASSAGPDLREVVMGSEGRMGIITEVKVRVTPLPETESFHVWFFPGWAEGRAAAQALVQQKVPLSMVRLSNAKETTSLLYAGGSMSKVQALEKSLSAQGIGTGKVMMTLGVTGTQTQHAASLAQVHALCVARDGVEADAEWGEHWKEGRFRGPYLRDPMGRRGYAVDTMETAVDWGSVDAAMEAIEASIEGALTEEGTKVFAYSHLSHVYGQGSSIYTTYIFPYAESYPATRERWARIKRAGAEQIVASGGTISHQHGVGTDHRPYLEAEKGALGIAALRSLYGHFDPKGQMNPGKLIPARER